jgi:hypothetical protein
VQVELDIFSGRENPTWSLTTDQAATVRQKLSNLPDNPNPSPDIFNGLGYRGFLLNDTIDRRVINVWRETVIICQGSTRSPKVDRERQLEQLLLLTARSHLEPELFRWVQTQIDAVPDYKIKKDTVAGGQLSQRNAVYFQITN